VYTSFSICERKTDFGTKINLNEKIKSDEKVERFASLQAYRTSDD